MKFTGPLLANGRRSRAGRKRGTATKKSIAKIAKAVVLRNTDKKAWYMAFTTTPLAGFGALAPMSIASEPSNINRVPIPGQQDSYREGTTVKITGIDYGIYLSAPALAAAHATLRLMLVRFPTNNGTGPSVLDILQYSSSPEGVVSTLQHDKPYQILVDKTLAFGNQQEGTYNYKFHKRFKAPITVQYKDTSTTGGVADINKGFLAWYMITDVPTGSYAFQQNVRFIDV